MTHVCASCGYGSVLYPRRIDDGRPCPRCGVPDINTILDLINQGVSLEDAERRCPGGPADPSIMPQRDVSPIEAVRRLIAGEAS